MLESGQRELKLFQEFKAFMRPYSGWYIFFLFFPILLYGMLALPAAFIFISILSLMGIYALVPGIALLAMSFLCFFRTLLLLANSHVARSKVIGYEDRDSQSTRCYTLTFLSRTKQQITARHVIMLDASFVSTFNLDSALILYNPHEPEKEIKLFTFIPIWCPTIIWAWLGWMSIEYGFTFSGKSFNTFASMGDFYLIFLRGVIVLFLFIFVVSIIFHFYRHRRCRKARLFDE